MKVGAKMGCHQRADRSFFIGKYQFPLCARCTGIVISSLVALLLNRKIRMNNKVSVMVTLPMIIDGGTQYLNIQESTNRRRLITGLLGGFGITTIGLNFLRWLLKA